MDKEGILLLTKKTKKSSFLRKLIGLQSIFIINVSKEKAWNVFLKGSAGTFNKTHGSFVKLNTSCVDLGYIETLSQRIDQRQQGSAQHISQISFQVSLSTVS